jgi:hypothetical protein
MSYKEFLRDINQSPLGGILIFFVFTAGMSLYLSFHHFHLAFYGIVTNATIVQAERGFRMSFYSYRFTTETGMVIESQPYLLPGDVERGTVGTIVPIVYRPDHPEIFISPGIRGRLPLLGILFIALVCGTMLVLSLTKNKEQSQNDGDTTPEEPDDMWSIISPASGWATAAMYVGLFAVLLLPAPIALILGIIALRDCKKRSLEGKGRAIFAIVMGAIFSLILLRGILEV